RLDDDTAAARHQPAEPGELAGLEIPLVLGRGAADAQHLAELAAVEDLDDFAQPPQAVGKSLSKRRLTGAGHARKPDGETARRHGAQVHGRESPSKKSGHNTDPDLLWQGIC